MSTNGTVLLAVLGIVFATFLIYHGNPPRKAPPCVCPPVEECPPVKVVNNYYHNITAEGGGATICWDGCVPNEFGDPVCKMEELP